MMPRTLLCRQHTNNGRADVPQTPRRPPAPFALDDYLPHLSVDCVVFGFHGGDLRLLLLKWKGMDTWSLPGGWIRRRESLDDAAARVLRERTGLAHVYLQQFRAFGSVRRGEHALRKLVTRLRLPLPRDAWPMGRVVSVAYFALVEFSEVTPAPDYASDECTWWGLDERPALAFDHDDIVAAALDALRQELRHRPVGMNLLPATFTMPELQHLYEAILGRPLDRRNFQKRILELGIVHRLAEQRTGQAGRSPYLYRFDAAAYARAVREGVGW
jgi:8-oxo-dGTP diphosphatase